MTYDIVIRGGTIVDGSGSEGRAGDLGIENGIITAMGKVDGQGHREIDAHGATVTPGFVDIHTHFDAQIGWDPDCTPVSWHGVTTALLGNCGVTFAPCKPSDRELLAGMMETVEDIPRNAILTGLPWSWEDYGGYLDAIEKIQPGINIAGLVGHSAVRFYVMGERAVEEQATPDELRRMVEVVGQSIDAGAAGFSINRLPMHTLPDGRAIPGTFAHESELIEIARTVAQRKGLVQAVGAELGLLTNIADATASRVLCSYGAGSGDLASAAQRRTALEEACVGRDITAITQVRGSGMIYGLQASLPVRGAAWGRVQRMANLSDRLAALDDPQMRDAMIEEARLRRLA